jgi:hypothetical protein
METITSKTLTGKTVSILERLPHFYHAEVAGGVLAAWVDIFGRRLERAEIDLYRVLRAHHVETADNEGAQGYIAPPEKRGDLDKIFALYLEALGGTALLVKVNPRFTVRSLDARRLSAALTEDATPLNAYVGKKLRLSTWKLLLRYSANRALFKANEIRPSFALSLLLEKEGPAAFIRGRLAPATRKLLSAYTGASSLDPALQAALSSDLNERILRDPQLYLRNEAFFSALPLTVTTLKLLRSVYRETLAERYSAEKNPTLRQQLLGMLEDVEPAPIPVGDDQIRLNRMLLEAASEKSKKSDQPWNFPIRNIPALEDVRSALVDEFNRLLDDPELYSEERFPDLVEDYPNLKKRYAKEPVWLNRTLLENAYPYELEKSYVPYRERLRGLIRVLRRGASSRQGIIDIVAANLGIVGDDPQTRSAKAQILVEEYDPERTHFFDGVTSLFQEFEVNNTNPGEETPEIWVRMLESPTKEICNLRFIDLASRRQIRVATRLQQGDTLVFKGAAVSLNGVACPDTPIGGIPVIPPGISRWRFEADLVSEDGTARPAGRFGQTNFDDSVWVSGDPVVQVEVLSYSYTPGAFTVLIPWHIPGFTDKFAETAEHPRHQILSLVNRVKAAGVQAQVAYHQLFSEDHAQTYRLGLALQGELLSDIQEMSDRMTASNTQNTREDQDIGDSLSLAGRFDLTSFDSLNKFSA